MRSLQDYRDIYREIANNNNITGDSVDLLIQLLANASFISEVENISYVQESSIERCTLVNSKIQHCMDNMYSVFRGRCPRVIIRFRPKKFMTFNVYDKICTLNNFSVYYLGYYKQEDNILVNDSSIDSSSKSVPVEKDFTIGPIQINPALDENNPEEVITIIGLIAKDLVTKTWHTRKYNTYYVETLTENLSNDMWVKISATGDDNLLEYPCSRVFSDHLMKKYVFDLTSPSFGSRLYVANIYNDEYLSRNDEQISSDDDYINIEANYFKNNSLSDYTESELKKINIKGAELVEIGNQDPIIQDTGYTQFCPGIILLSSVSSDGLDVIHYKAIRDRFLSSIIRSNNDVGDLLEQEFPDKIIPYGTTYKYLSNATSNAVEGVYIWYIPKNTIEPLTDEEKASFIEHNSGYYVVQNISINEGVPYTAKFIISLNLSGSVSVDSDISKILSNYDKKFNIDFREIRNKIVTDISKLNNVFNIENIRLIITNEIGQTVSDIVYYSNSDETGLTNPDFNTHIEKDILGLVSGDAKYGYYNIKAEVLSTIQNIVL